MGQRKNQKTRFGVAQKLSLGFFCILLMLIYIALQSNSNYRKTSQTLSSLITVSDGILSKTSQVQTTVLMSVADFKRIAEKTKSKEIKTI